MTWQSRQRHDRRRQGGGQCRKDRRLLQKEPKYHGGERAKGDRKDVGHPGLPTRCSKRALKGCSVISGALEQPSLAPDELNRRGSADELDILASHRDRDVVAVQAGGNAALAILLV